MQEQAKEQEKLERELKQLGEAFDKAVEQVGHEKVARSLIDKWTTNAQDSSKIYWKG